MATLIENAMAVKAASGAIDAAIIAKGGTTSGGLKNAADAIKALPDGTYDRIETRIYLDLTDEAAPLDIAINHYWKGETVHWGDGITETTTDDWFTTPHHHIYARHDKYIVIMAGNVSANAGFSFAYGGQYIDRIELGNSVCGLYSNFPVYGATVNNGICAIIKKSKGNNQTYIHMCQGIFNDGCDITITGSALPTRGIRSLTLIGNDRYGDKKYNCDYVKLIVKAATKIQGNWCENFTLLTHLEFDESLSSFDWDFFGACAPTIRTMIMRSAVPPVWNHFQSFRSPFKENDYSIRVPSSSLSSYTIAYPWSLKADHIVPIGSAWDLALTGYGDAIAKFDLDGNIVGGAAFDAPTVTTATQVKWTGLAKYFDATQKAAIEAAMSAKGYSVAW